MADLDTDLDDTEDESDTDSGAAPAAMNPLVSAYLQNKQSLAEAQQKASTNQLLAGIGRAGGTLASSAYGATAGPDTAAYNALDKNANLPVQQEQERQAAQGKDPNSPLAQQLRKIYAPIFKKAGIDPQSLDALGADDIKQYAQNPLEFIDKQKTLESTKSLAVTAAANARADKQEEKENTDQAKAYTLLRKDLENYRGNQSIQQAALAVQNSDKALALAKSVPTPQNLALLADEMGKIAMGGVPGEHGTQMLLPNNLNTKIAEIKSWVTGHPNANAADVQEYINNNIDYINQVKAISSKALRGYRQNIAKGYKKRLDPDDYQEVMSDYSLDGESPDTSAAAGGGATVARKTKDGRTAIFDAATKKFLRYQ